jgi:hypothetical protein
MTIRTPTALALAGLSLATLAAPASAAEGDVRGGCRDGTCYMLRLSRVQPVDESNIGRLVYVKARTWSERDGVSSAAGEEDGYAFCSTRAPALVTVDGERVRATWLAPQSAAEAARQRSPYVLYFEACHGAGSEAAEDVSGTADRFGYEVLRQARSTVEVGEPQEVLRLAEAARAPDRPGRVASPRLYGWPGYMR